MMCGKKVSISGQCNNELSAFELKIICDMLNYFICHQNIKFGKYKCFLFIVKVATDTIIFTTKKVCFI